MSFTITTDVFCDYCPLWMEEGGVSCGNKIQRKEAWKRATHFGWKKIKNKHACPKCVKKLDSQKSNNRIKTE